jgi:hypothetical protein
MKSARPCNRRRYIETSPPHAVAPIVLATSGTCSGGAARIDSNWQNTVFPCQKFDPLPHPPISPRGGGSAAVLASPLGLAPFHSVQVFKANGRAGRAPLPRQWLDGAIAVVVARNAGTPLPLLAGQRQRTQVEICRQSPPIAARRWRQSTWRSRRRCRSRHRLHGLLARETRPRRRGFLSDKAQPSTRRGVDCRRVRPAGSRVIQQ